MVTQQILNPIMCILSFIMFFSCLVMDLYDKKNGSIVRQMLYLILMLYNCSLLIRVSRGNIQDLLVLWFLLSMVMFVRKILVIKGTHRIIEQKIHEKITMTKPAGVRKTPQRTGI